MNNIVLHIDYLLLRHNWVVVPKLGAFVCEHKPAYFDSETETWYAPRQQVGFVAGRFPTDEILERSIARKECVGVRVAREIVANGVDELLDSLSLEDKVVFPGFGEFYKSTSGVVAFKSYLTHQEYNKATGRYPIKMEELWGVKNNLETLQKENAFVEDSNEAAQELTTSAVEKRTKFSVGIFWAKAACLLMFIALSLSFVVPTSVDIRDIEGEEVATKTIVEEAVGNDKKEPTSAKNIQQEEVVNFDKDNKKYHLIVGTFRSESEARKFISIKNDTTKTLRTLPTKTLCRVAYESSDDFEELRRKLNSKEIREVYQGAWIWDASHVRH